MGRVNSEQIWIYFYCVVLVASLAAIAYSIWLHFSDSGGATLCQKLLKKPLLILGVFQLVVSGLALVGLLCRVTFISCICVISLSLIFLGLFCLVLFEVLVSRALFGRDGNYSHYLWNKYFLNEENWEEIKSCLTDFKFCQPVGKRVHFYKYFNPVFQPNCCKPPTYCGLAFNNDTYWTIP